MNHGRFTIKEFFSFPQLEQVLIPEIQRDYVWKKENINKLLLSIIADFSAKTETDASVSEDQLKQIPAALREEFARMMAKKKTFSNIGFIYAYFDTEQFAKYMLIDGQQRLTSVFLILLHLYIKENRIGAFKRIYYPNDRPKVDYKVRENAHVFLLDFIDYLLDNGEPDKVREQYWFYSSYKNDTTINSLIDNYQAIVLLLSNHQLSAEYVEDYVEFWYFDTNQSAQGEDLYLYMNSRGESVQTNENIKAELLEHKAEAEKHQWGAKWEDWQNTFWLHRGKSPNADRGFDEFLKWIKIINKVRSVHYAKTIDLTDTIREIRDSKKFTTEGISLENISSYYHAVQKLLALNLGRYFNSGFLSEEPGVLVYVRLLPLLMYAERYPNATHLELIRYARFFFNIIRFDNISKNPYPHIGQVIQLTHDFLEKGCTDITDLTQFKVDGLYENIITGEELQKLFLYSINVAGITREELEAVFWEAEDFALCDGRIRLMWYCMDYKPFKNENFNKKQFSDYFNAFKLLFQKPTDQLRRALLSKGDYSIKDGYSTSLQSDRWTFGSNNTNWKNILNTDERDDILKELLSDYLDKQSKNGLLSNGEVLSQIIDQYLAENADLHWSRYFISDKRVLDYCKDKMICFGDDLPENINLLQGQKAVENGYITLKDFLKKK
ncbi:DUF262 domain-containing protein [Mucilaginibacter sp. NFX135]|uniref:DUF262 domain-containing protein n=1 Tax=Mucilaginibacter sp. NFX135 TaxID=3402687 RepID=UPI003AFB349C